MVPQLLWIGAVTDPSGYGEATRGYLCSLLDDRGVDLRLQSRSFWTGDPICSDEIGRLTSVPVGPFPSGKYVGVQHLTPENFSYLGPDCSAHVGMTTFETDSVPTRWLRHMKVMDEIWTFSEWGKAVFDGTNLSRRVSVIPHGVDSDRFCPDGAELSGVTDAIGSDVFVFGAVFDWTSRKDPRSLLTAFFQEFKDSDDVVLLLKAFHQFPYRQSAARVRAEVESIKDSVASDSKARVFVIGDLIPSGQLPAFYRTIDAYVTTTHGEGWGMPITEAMATELPVIATGWSAITDYANRDNALLLDHRLVPVTPGEDPNGLYVGHHWAQVDVGHVRECMRRLVDDAYLRTMLGVRARRDMVENWSWRHAAAKIVGRIAGL